MRKVAILTMAGYNFGNRLQNYALQQTLEQMGCRAQTLLRSRDSLFKKCKRRLRPLFKKDVFSQCIKFDRMIDWSRDIVSARYVSPGLGQDYDAFVMGSDQIWNITLDIVTANDFLPMVEPGKKLSYAASFGTAQIPADRREWLAGLLNAIPHISVREEAGQRIVKETTGRDAELVVDPTLLLTAEQWRDLAAAPPDLAPQKPYILTYFLGPEPQKAGADKAKAMQDRGWVEYHLLERTDPKSCKAGPREFLYLIDHAQLILTDSFHACVFSFLFGRPFCVYPREGKETGMLSRIESLLKMFSLERKFSGSGLPNELLEHEYTAGYAALEKERGKAKRYLAASLAEILENKGAQQRTMRF